MTDLQEAYAALSGKQTPYSQLYAYSEGAQPLKYSTARLREAFDDISTHFSQNWCSVVINAAEDRLTLQGWDALRAGDNTRLDDLWNRERISIEAGKAHHDTLVTGEGFIIAWKDGDALDVYRNDPRLCAMFYDPERPKRKRFAAKWWTDKGAWYMTLYYSDRLEYYAAQTKDMPSSAAAFRPMQPPTAPNPFGTIPVFHFRGPGELGNILSLQDAVNKLFADMMVTAEFLAFPQRWFITNADLTAVRNAPYESLVLPAGDGTEQATSVGQFAAAPLDNYLNAIDKIANSIAIISRTPKHYFYSASNLSGEALLAMEAPLTKKVNKYQEDLGVTWQELGAFLLRLTGGGALEPADITPLWEPSESIQPYTEAQTRQLAVASGIPLVTQLSWEGKPQSVIDAMLKDEEEVKQRSATMAPLLLEQARAVSASANTNPLDPNQGANNGRQ